MYKSGIQILYFIPGHSSRYRCVNYFADEVDAEIFLDEITEDGYGGFKIEPLVVGNALVYKVDLNECVFDEIGEQDNPLVELGNSAAFERHFHTLGDEKTLNFQLLFNYAYSSNGLNKELRRLDGSYVFTFLNYTDLKHVFDHIKNYRQSLLNLKADLKDILNSKGDDLRQKAKGEIAVLIKTIDYFNGAQEFTSVVGRQEEFYDVKANPIKMTVNSTNRFLNQLGKLYYFLGSVIARNDHETTVEPEDQIELTRDKRHVLYYAVEFYDKLAELLGAKQCNYFIKKYERLINQDRAAKKIES